MTTNDTRDRDGIVGGALTVALLITLAVQNAVPPMATDMYSAAFPQITVDLATNSTMLGFTLTTFFVGFASGQVLGGAISDQIGRRRPIIAGGIIALVGSIICVFTPGIWVLLVGRVFQGLGGGVASSVGRAILVDVAHGKTLARAMSLLQAIVGFAPMLAPVLGAFIITHATWRVVFWALAAFTLLMAALAWFVVPESLPEDRRHPGGIPRFFHGLVQVVRIRPFVGFMLTNAFSSFCMFGYISNATYVLQGPLGLSPMAFAWVFAFNALLSTGFALVNVRLISHFTPRTLIVTGLTIAATGVVTLTISTFLLDLPLILTCAGFASPACTSRGRERADPHVRGLRAHHDCERFYFRQLGRAGHERGARARGHGLVRDGCVPVDRERHRRSPGDLGRRQRRADGARHDRRFGRRVVRVLGDRPRRHAHASPPQPRLRGHRASEIGSPRPGGPAHPDRKSSSG